MPGLSISTSQPTPRLILAATHSSCIPVSFVLIRTDEDVLADAVVVAGRSHVRNGRLASVYLRVRAGICAPQARAEAPRKRGPSVTASATAVPTIDDHSSEGERCTQSNDRRKLVRRRMHSEGRIPTEHADGCCTLVVRTLCFTRASWYADNRAPGRPCRTGPFAHRRLSPIGMQQAPPRRLSPSLCVGPSTAAQTRAFGHPTNGLATFWPKMNVVGRGSS